jgi:hypothetical protein
VLSLTAYCEQISSAESQCVITGYLRVWINSIFDPKMWDVQFLAGRTNGG